MNKATRSTLTVLLALALIGGLALADDADNLYEKLFGAEAKKVAASSTKTDDVALAAKMLKTAKMRPDLPDLQIVLYEKAFEFGTAATEGCDTALEALVLLRKANAARKTDTLLQKKVAAHELQALQKDLDAARKQFDTDTGAARIAAGKRYLRTLEAIADIKIAECKAAEAKVLYYKALNVAAYIKSPRAASILAKSKRVNAMTAQKTKRKELQDRLQANPKDEQSRKELILLYIVVFDNPARAAGLLSDDVDKTTRAYVSLAAKRLKGLDKATCLKLGDWYYKTLSKNVSGALRLPLLRRAKGYYRRGLAIPTTTKDGRLARDRTWAILVSIEKELKGPAARTAHVSPPKGREKTKGNDNPPATARAVVCQGMTIKLSDDGKTLTAADNATGKLLWRCGIRQAATGISVDQRTIKVSPNGEAFDARTGKRLR
ncbi:MAG: hypothetical protein QGH60_11865 [Phycisphaerae bacterium]|jgi:hypothetical protein|nr:hypothetical protein [Phycisphaerae bacterium]